MAWKCRALQQLGEEACAVDLGQFAPHTLQVATQGPWQSAIQLVCSSLERFVGSRRAGVIR